ncbi:MAG: sigma-70 family RNA polymerase sigma factor [Verrucomicrobiaceae bacterium]|nr:sigma-70 family RNA polymerase sigma factor [Verrucomicrobiaceae bacterium]
MSASSAAFLTTRWTRVCLAKADSEDGRRALAELCDAYYEPVVTFLRCTLRDADAAREMSHAFFAEMLQGGTIHTAEQERGRFRSYLLGAVNHFLSHQRVRANRLKRGGDVEQTHLDDNAACEVADSDHLSPSAAYDRQWALTVLDRALDSLREELRAEGCLALFDHAKPWLTGEASHGDQGVAAERCGMTPAAFKMAVHRLKRRFRQCVKAEIAGTLDDPTMVAEEMASLFAALGGAAM